MWFIAKFAHNKKYYFCILTDCPTTAACCGSSTTTGMDWDFNQLYQYVNQHLLPCGHSGSEPLPGH